MPSAIMKPMQNTSYETQQIQNLILDMDGVLWLGETPLPGLVEFFETVRSLNLGFVLATNNATKTTTQYTEKLLRFGIEVPTSAILTSAEATAHYLSKQYPEGASVYVVGEEGLRLALKNCGFQLLAEEDDGILSASRLQADLVVVGFTRHACYRQLASAATLVNNGARFVGTNPDVTFPHEIGPLPGAGALLAFIQAATGRAPLVIGKPGRAIFEEALHRLGSSPEATAMVGDRLETDISGAQAAGLKTILLLTGVTKREQLAGSDIVPDLVMEGLEQLTGYLKAQEGQMVKSHDA